MGAFPFESARSSDATSAKSIIKFGVEECYCINQSFPFQRRERRETDSQYGTERESLTQTEMCTHAHVHCCYHSKQKGRRGKGGGDIATEEDVWSSLELMIISIDSTQRDTHAYIYTIPGDGGDMRHCLLGPATDCFSCATAASSDMDMASVSAASSSSSSLITTAARGCASQDV